MLLYRNIFVAFNQIKQPVYEYASTQNHEIDYES
jgi:hypothetical protein